MSWISKKLNQNQTLGRLNNCIDQWSHKRIALDSDTNSKILPKFNLLNAKRKSVSIEYILKRWWRSQHWINRPRNYWWMKVPKRFIDSMENSYSPENASRYKSWSRSFTFTRKRAWFITPMTYIQNFYDNSPSLHVAFGKEWDKIA